MAQKPLTYILLVLLIGGGFLVGSFFGGSLVGGLVAPSNHKKIAENFKIYDNNYGYLPAPTFMYSSTLKYAESLSTLPSQFTVNSPYTFSLWTFQRKGDTEVTLEIWGPDDTGHGYAVCLARTGLGSGGLIEYKGVEVMTISSYAEQPPIENGEGYRVEGEYFMDITEG